MEIAGEFRRTWATWSILYAGGEDEMELALKVFDRIRFPIDIERDMHLLIDTWGTDFREGDYDKLYGRENSHFSVVEKEIKSAADLGIEIVRIDDGWQAGANSRISTWRPDTTAGYSPDWSKVKALSEKFGVRIGLWASIRRISNEEMLWNHKKLNVATWKLDYERIVDWETFHGRMRGMREFILSCNHQTQVSWCPEYTSQRYGWYSEAREYGPMFFQNIMNNLPRHIIYVPYITLKHHWMMSRFYNMNKLQCSWQNPTLTNPAFSDAVRHSHSYAAMASLVGVPSFFMLTQYLDPVAREEIKKLINIYKEHRHEIFGSYVFPIGAQPDNQSWTGFQICHPESNKGYLMVFRELHNDQNTHTIQLRFLKDKNIRILDLENPDEEATIRVNSEGGIPLTIKDPAGYLFLKYYEDGAGI
jgi:hypothetical protein